MSTRHRQVGEVRRRRIGSAFGRGLGRHCGPVIATVSGMMLLCGCVGVEPSLKSDSPVTHTCSNSADGPTTQIRTLGTAGGPILKKLRSQPANLLTVNGVHYLIDAGDGVARQMTLSGLRISDVKSVFMTHLHADHVAGLASVMLFAWTSGVARPTVIHGPPGTERLVESGLNYIETPVNIHRLQYPPIPVPKELFSAVKPKVGQGDHPTLIYEDDNVSVLAVENSHYALLPEGSQNPYGVERSYSYRFESQDRSVVFSGDTGVSQALTTLARDADVLVIEVIDLERQIDVIRKMTGLPDEQLTVVFAHMEKEHISPEQIGQLASDASVGQVVLTHVVPGLDGETDFSRYIQGVRRNYNGPVALASDLDCF